MSLPRNSFFVESRELKVPTQPMNVEDSELTELNAPVVSKA